MGNTPDFHRIPVSRKPGWALAFEIKTTLLRQRSKALTELLHDRSGIEWLDVALLAPRLQAGETREVVEKMMERGDVTHQDAYEVVAGRVSSSVAREPHRDIGHDTQVAAKVMRRLLPQIAAFLFQLADFIKRGLEVLDVTRSFPLLKGKVLAHALLDASTAQFSPDLACAGHCIERNAGIGPRIVIQFQYDALIELAQLSGDLAQIIALPPALQAMRRARFECGTLTDIPWAGNSLP